MIVLFICILVVVVIFIIFEMCNQNKKIKYIHEKINGHDKTFDFLANELHEKINGHDKTFDFLANELNVEWPDCKTCIHKKICKDRKEDVYMYGLTRKYNINKECMNYKKDDFSHGGKY